MNKMARIILGLLLVAGIFAAQTAYGGWAGVVAALLLVTLLVIAVETLDRWWWGRLARSMEPADTLVASGLIGGAPAILVRDPTSHYRLLAADSSGALPVDSATPNLRYLSGFPLEPGHIELHTPEGTMRFSTGHPQQVLDTILATLPPAQLSETPLSPLPHHDKYYRPQASRRFLWFGFAVLIFLLLLLAFVVLILLPAL